MSDTQQPLVSSLGAFLRGCRRALLSIAGHSARTEDPVDQNEEARFIAMGSAILITTSLAMISSFVAVTSVFEEVPRLGAAGISAFWGFVVFTFDRWIVSVTPYGNLGRDPKAPSLMERASYYGITAARILFAAVLGVVIAEPLVMKLFGEEIERERAAVRSQIDDDDELIARRDDFEESEQAEIDRIVSEQGTLKGDINALRTSINDNKKLRDEAAAKRAEEAESGEGRKWRDANDRFNRYTDEIESESNRLNELINQRNDLSKQLSDATGSLEEARNQSDEEIEEEIEASRKLRFIDGTGFLADEELLSRVIDDDDKLTIIRWLPTAVVVAIDILPVLLKLLSGASVQDERLKYRARIAHLEARSDYELAVLAIRARHSRAEESLESGTDTIDIRNHDRIIHAAVGRSPANGAGAAADDSEVDGGVQLRPGPGGVRTGSDVIISHFQYRLFGRVGSGSGGDIHLALPLDDDPLPSRREERPAVVKVLSLEGVGQVESEALQKASQHPNIVNFRGGSLVGDRYNLVFDYFPRSSVDRWLLGSPVTPNVTAGLVRQWLNDLTNGLHALWAAGYVHVDGKPLNILIAGDIETQETSYSFDPPPDRLVLCDLGDVVPIGSNQQANRFTLGYAAPEILGGRDEFGATTVSPPTIYADVYASLGGLLFFILSGGHHPNHVEDASGAEFGGQAAKPIARSAQSRLHLIANAPPSLVRLCTQWLQDQPDDRVPGYPDNPTELHTVLTRQIINAFEDVDSELTVFERAADAPMPDPPPGYPTEYLEAMNLLDRTVATRGGV